MSENISENKRPEVRARDRRTVLKSLRAGVTPANGLHLIQVGRVGEINSLVEDLNGMKEGDSTFRLIIGDYGSGKTFFLHMIRETAWQSDFVTVHADLSPERRLQSSKGYARALYAELMNNISTRTKSNAMSTIVEKFLTSVRNEANKKNMTAKAVITERLDELSDLRNGHYFAEVIQQYWEAHQKDDHERKLNVIRWLRAEYDKKTEAKRDLGISCIIEDDSFLDALKLMSLFVRQAGYSGLLVCMDEMVNIFKMSNTLSRSNNYEKMLMILNDSLQGNSPYLGFILSGTPEFLEDKKKGVASYEALSSRLAENQFAAKIGKQDFSTTVLRLSALEPEDLFVLLQNLRHVHASGDPEKYLVSDEVLHAFLQHCNKVIGSAYYSTPRNTIKSFLDFLSTLEKNPEYQKNWQALLTNVTVAKEYSPDHDEISDDEDDDDLTHFSL